MSTIRRLTRTDCRVPREVLAADIFRVARAVLNAYPRNSPMNAMRIRDMIMDMYPEVSFVEFRQALAYLGRFLHDDDD